MHAQRLFRPVVPIMLALLVYPALARAQPNETPPGQSAATPNASAYAGGVAVILLDVPNDWSTGIEPGMIEGMATAGVEGMSYGAVVDALSEQPELINCDNERCLTRAAEALDVEWFIKIRVAADELSLELTLELWTTTVKHKTISSKCTPCSQGQLTEAITQGIAELFKPPEDVPIEITSDPVGAVLTIDDEKAGSTPYAGKQKPGMHTIQATYPEFLPERRQIMVEEKAKVGDEEVQRFSLVLAPVPIVKVPDRPFAILKWIGVGASLGAMATGGFWLYIDGKGTCGLFTDEVCKDIYNTNTQGLAVLGGGLALGVATALMFWSDSKTMAGYQREKKTAMMPIIVPTQGGALARFQLNF